MASKYVKGITGYPKKKKPAKKKARGRYSQAELKKIQAARKKATAANRGGYTKAELQAIAAARKKSVAAKKKAASKKKPSGDNISDFLRTNRKISLIPQAKKKKSPVAAKKKAAAKKDPVKALSKKKAAVKKPVLTPKSLKKSVAKKAPVKAVSKAKPAKVAKKAPVASKKKKKRSLLGRLKMRKLKKMSKRGTPVTKPKGVPRGELSPKGRIRKGAKKVLLTKGGAYASYEKGSKAAKSFQSAFKSGCAGNAKSFSWDGRSYSCKKK